MHASSPERSWMCAWACVPCAQQTCTPHAAHSHSHTHRHLSCRCHNAAGAQPSLCCHSSAHPFTLCQPQTSATLAGQLHATSAHTRPPHTLRLWGSSACCCCTALPSQPACLPASHSALSLLSSVFAQLDHAFPRQLKAAATHAQPTPRPVQPRGLLADLMSCRTHSARHTRTHRCMQAWSNTNHHMPHASLVSVMRQTSMWCGRLAAPAGAQDGCVPQPATRFPSTLQLYPAGVQV
jgi:hypothetical protein